MQVIEKIKQFEESRLKYIDECYIVPILTDDKKHPRNNELSLLYIQSEDDEFILGFNHSETLGLPIDYLNKLKFDKVYIPNKKSFSSGDS